MKKLLLLCLLLSSCTPIIKDTGIVNEVRKRPSQSSSLYAIVVSNCDTRGYGYVTIYTNTFYQVGDTIKIVKK